MSIHKSRFIPSIEEVTNKSTRTYDIYSRALKDRIIFITDEIETNMAADMVAQLIILESESKKKPITLYIDTPGGCVMSGLKIIDTMNLIECPVITIAQGMCASMGFALVSAGTKGMRYSLPSAQFMMHQISHGYHGNIQDTRVSHKHSEFLNDMLMQMIADNCGQTKEKILKDSIHDKWFQASEAIKYGVIDKILYKKLESDEK